MVQSPADTSSSGTTVTPHTAIVYLSQIRKQLGTFQMNLIVLFLSFLVPFPFQNFIPYYSLVTSLDLGVSQAALSLMNLRVLGSRQWEIPQSETVECIFFNGNTATVGS